MTPFALGVIAAILSVAIDQAQKLYCLNILEMVEGQHFALTPFLDIFLAWNRGISFSLFQQHTEFGRWALFAFKIAAAVLLAIWLWRASTRLTGIAIGLVIGGALGNAIDRAAYGAVADFFYFHVGGFSWYVFNLADCAIVVGVALLLYDAWMAPKLATDLP